MSLKKVLMVRKVQIFSFLSKNAIAGHRGGVRWHNCCGVGKKVYISSHFRCCGAIVQYLQGVDRVRVRVRVRACGCKPPGEARAHTGGRVLLRGVALVARARGGGKME